MAGALIVETFWQRVIEDEVDLPGGGFERPDEAGEIVAKAYNLEPAVAKSAIRYLTTSTTQGVPYWSSGQIRMEGLKRIIEVQRKVGALKGEIDIAKMIDTRFLPDDLKAIK